MQVSDVEAVLVDIKEKAKHDYDYIDAHEFEDQLMIRVLRAIVGGCDNGPELAKAALKSLDIEFIHHYA